MLSAFLSGSILWHLKNPSGRGEAPRGWVRYQCQQRLKAARYQPWGPLYAHTSFDVSQLPAALNKGVDSLLPATPEHSPVAQQQRGCWLMPVPKVPTYLQTSARAAQCTGSGSATLSHHPQPSPP